MSHLWNVLLIEQNLDGTTGGSYRSLLYLVARLDRSRFRPLVAFYRGHDLLEAFHQAGVETLLLKYLEPVDLVGRRPWLGRPWAKPARLFLLLIQKVVNLVGVSGFLFFQALRVLRREKIDLVHLNNGVTVGTEVLLAARLLGRRCVVHQRGIGRIPRWNARLTTLVEHVICVSEAARANLIRQGVVPDRCTTVHNGIEPEEFLGKLKQPPESVRARLGIPDGSPVIGVAGMIREWKGQMVLLEAMLKLRDRHPDLRCLIVGGVADGHDRDLAYLESLRRFVREHGLDSRVVFLDYERNIGDLLRVLDVMVHTAIDPEPFSRVVLEGMTLGRPLVATRTGGTPEAIEDGVSGVLVPPNDPETLADRIDYLLSHADIRRRLGSAARQRIQDRFLISRNVEATERIYRRILNGKDSREP